MLLVLSMAERMGTYDFTRFSIAGFRDGPCLCILRNPMRLSMGNVWERKDFLYVSIISPLLFSLVEQICTTEKEFVQRVMISGTVCPVGHVDGLPWPSRESAKAPWRKP